ncbi:MAG: tetratricopeptide repeat protein [Thermoplasmata archaeon]|nr:tetratricopeptide repeat protein [Thermoplasmata archaeon]
MAGENSDASRIAVLPLTNISPEPKDEFLADGLTEELISVLSRVPGTRVIARTSAMRYKATTKGIAEIARELRVSNILEGSVRRDGQKLRVAVQLIDAHSEEHIWSAEYDRELSDIFSIQRDIARRVAKALRLHFRRSEQLSLERRSTPDIDAYTLYLEGRFRWNQRTEADLEAAIQLFEKAISKDPTFSLAHAGRADAYSSLALLEFLPPSDAFPKARASAEEALRIDPNLAEAHSALGLVRFQYEREFAGAERELRRGIELNPNYPAAHQFYADYLKALGRFDEALKEMGRALELDPVSLAINTGLGHVLYLSRQYDRAIEQYRSALALDPDFVQAHLWFGRPYLEKGMFDEAIRELRIAVELSKGSTISLAVLAHALASAGRSPEAREILTKLLDRARTSYLPSYWIALIFTGLGETDAAMTWLERAAQERSSWLVWIKVEPRFDALRPLPRFQSLLSRLGLSGSSIDDHPLLEFLAGLSELDLRQFTVVGAYTRHEERARHFLKDIRHLISSGGRAGAGALQNLLLWAPPGSGKTFLVRESARSSGPEIRYVEINLAETTEAEFRNGLKNADRHEGPAVVFIDEIDSKPAEPWPYEALLPHLDRGDPDRPARVFVLAGSGGASLEEMQAHVRARPKGPDLLSRIPTEYQKSLPPLTAEDRVLVAISNLRSAAADRTTGFGEIEKLALYYIATSTELENPRQLREFIVRCAGRVPLDEDRIRFDHLFAPGDPQSKEFWVRLKGTSPELIDRFVRIVP